MSAPKLNITTATILGSSWQSAVEGFSALLYRNFSDEIMPLSDGKIPEGKYGNKTCIYSQKKFASKGNVKFGASYAVKFCGNIVLEMIFQYINRDGVLYDFIEYIHEYLNNLFVDGEFGLTFLNESLFRERLGKERREEIKDKGFQELMDELVEEADGKYDISSLTKEEFEKIISVCSHILLLPCLVTTTAPGLNPIGIIGSILLYARLTKYSRVDDLKATLSAISAVSNAAKSKSRSTKVEKTVDVFKDSNFKDGEDLDLDSKDLNY